MVTNTDINRCAKESNRDRDANMNNSALGVGHFSYKERVTKEHKRAPLGTREAAVGEE